MFQYQIYEKGGAELWQDQFKLGIAMQEVSLFATKYPASQMSNV